MGVRNQERTIFMSYIDEIFKRLDIQHIREFLLHGVEEMNISDKGYKERIDEVRKPVIEFFQRQYPEMDECEKITNKVYDLASIYEEVYMEIGLQCGLLLAMQIVNNIKHPTESEANCHE